MREGQENDSQKTSYEEETSKGSHEKGESSKSGTSESTKPIVEVSTSSDITDLSTKVLKYPFKTYTLTPGVTIGIQHV